MRFGYRYWLLAGGVADRTHTARRSTNLLNAQPAYIPNGTIGQWYPVYTTGYSIQSPMGRYFTLGLRASL